AVPTVPRIFWVGISHSPHIFGFSPFTAVGQLPPCCQSPMVTSTIQRPNRMIERSFVPAARNKKRLTTWYRDESEGEVTQWDRTGLTGMDGCTFEIFYVDDSRDDLFYLEYVRKKENVPVALACYPDAEAAYAALETRLSEGEPLPSVLVADF